MVVTGDTRELGVKVESYGALIYGQRMDHARLPPCRGDGIPLRIRYT